MPHSLLSGEMGASTKARTVHFFRYSSDDKTIIYVWVNDDRSRRAYGSKTDAYKVFRRMLAAGNPPDTWEQLLSHATRNTRRMRRAAPDDTEP